MADGDDTELEIELYEVRIKNAELNDFARELFELFEKQNLGTAQVLVRVAFLMAQVTLKTTEGEHPEALVANLRTLHKVAATFIDELLSTENKRKMN